MSKAKFWLPAFLIVGVVFCFVGSASAGLNSTRYSNSQNMGIDPATVFPDGNVMAYDITWDDTSNVEKTNITIYAKSQRISIFITSADICSASSSVQNGALDVKHSSDMQNSTANNKRVVEYSVNGSNGGGAAAYNASTWGRIRSDSFCNSSRDGGLPWAPNPNSSGSTSYATTTQRLTVDANNAALMPNTTDIYKYDFTAAWNDIDGLLADKCIKPDSSWARCLNNEFRIVVLNGGPNGSGYGDDKDIWVSSNPERGVREFGVRAGVTPNGAYTGFRTYFATDCGFNPNSPNRSIQIYDDDNDANAGGAQPEADKQFQIKLEMTDRDNPKWGVADDALASAGPVHTFVEKDSSVANWTFRERDSNGWITVGTDRSFVTIKINFTMNEDKAYRLIIRQVHSNNVLQFKVPYGTVWADYSCSANARLKPASTVNKSEITMGTDNSAAWTHTAWNKSNQNEWPEKVANWRVVRTFLRPDGSTESTQTVAQSTSPATRLPTIGPDATHTLTSSATPNPYTFTLNPASHSTMDGWQVCQQLEISPWKRLTDGTYDTAPPVWQISEPPACVRINVPVVPCVPGVDPGCTTTPQYVNLQAIVVPPSETETTTTASFNGRVNVSNFPAPVDGGWGYNERSTQHDATRVSGFRQRDATLDSDSRTGYECPSGYPTASSTPITSSTTCSYSYPSTTCSPGDSYIGGGKCRINPAFCTVSASNTCQYPATGGSSGSTSSSSYTEYRYRCEESGSWTSWSRSSSDPCTDYYACPNGSSVTAYAHSTSGITCNVWQCLYPGAQAGRQSDPMRTQTNTYPCSYRCGGSYGNKAHLSSSWDDVSGSQDRRCFVQPQFELICVWENGTSMSVTVQSNGDYCNMPVLNKQTGAIGSVVCAQLRPMNPTGWNTSPEPGYLVNSSGNVQQVNKWYWNRTNDTKCGNVVGMPYVHAYGGDVRVGGGIAATGAANCSVNSSAQIRAYNSGPSNYTGAGVQYAAISTGFIDRFISGQFNHINQNATPNPGARPTALTFANNAGGSGYGGGFDNVGACYRFGDEVVATETVTGATLAASGPIVVGSVTNPGEKRVLVANDQDVYIRNNIVYFNGVWSEPYSIPIFQLIVRGGNIFIDRDVTQLDGLYAALPKADGTKGQIYTCSFGPTLANVPTTSFRPDNVPNCKRQLVVNGAFSAKRVYLYRDCGSVIHAQPDEGPLYTGGLSADYCGGTNSAAEIFNYSPEQWIRASSGPAADKYDAISSMPPVL